MMSPTLVRALIYSTDSVNNAPLTTPQSIIFFGIAGTALVALAFLSAPTYCSPRCYRAGIKRAYRAKRKSAASITSERQCVRRPLPPTLARGQIAPVRDETITIDDVRAVAPLVAQQDLERIRSLALSIRGAFKQHRT
jgi:hypothetical protein